MDLYEFLLLKIINSTSIVSFIEICGLIPGQNQSFKHEWLKRWYGIFCSSYIDAKYALHLRRVSVVARELAIKYESS